MTVTMQYDALAPIYDRLMSHVEYEEWVDLIKRVVARYGNSRFPRIFELGAGTGVLGSTLVKMGYSYIGSDLSLPMCHQAHSIRNLPVCTADARFLPVKTKFDLVLFLYDGINYLRTVDDFAVLFQSVAKMLSPGGLFLFDITTEANSLRHFSEYLDFEDYGDFSFVRHSYYDDNTCIQHNDFTIYKQSDENPRLFEKFKERHRQRVYPVSAIEQVIPAEHFNILGIWDGYSFKRYSPRSERIHFLLRKSGPR